MKAGEVYASCKLNFLLFKKYFAKAFSLPPSSIDDFSQIEKFLQNKLIKTNL